MDSKELSHSQQVEHLGKDPPLGNSKELAAFLRLVVQKCREKRIEHIYDRLVLGRQFATDDNKQ